MQVHLDFPAAERPTAVFSMGLVIELTQVIKPCSKDALGSEFMGLDP